jgi:hypothetical protein
MNQYDKILKEWTAMLSYVSGTYKGTIKALSKANGIDYNRCIRMNKSLKKKANKVEYVNSLIKKYTVLRDSVAESVVAEPVIAEVPVNLIKSPSCNKLDVPEYITKKEFDNYIKTLNATLDLIIETQKYSDILTTILLVIISIFSIFACVNLSFH